MPMPHQWIPALAVAAACTIAQAPAPARPDTRPDFKAISERVDPHVDRQRVVVLTDIANEPDDQMSMVRFLVYSNEFDVEGLVAGTSTWMKNNVRPDVINTLIDAYANVRPNLARHANGYPDPAALRGLVASGQPSYGMAAVGPDKMSAGAEQILRAADRDDPRPLWITVWGGANTLAQALLHARATRSPEAIDKLQAKLRVYAISDQDDAGPWIRANFPSIAYIVMPSTPDGDQYAMATWTGISGDQFYKNSPGADFTTFTKPWVDRNIRAKGPLGKLYPYPCCIHEGDTPSFLGLIDNGLDSAMSPTYGGWGGRYVWRQFFGEPHPLWTQGGDAFPGRDSSRDTVIGVDGKAYTSDQATIWRWREAFQHDFAARMDWTIDDRAHANHNPIAIVNGEAGKAPIVITATIGTTITLDASASTDPDGNRLTFTWFFYPEAGTGIPTQPVFAAGRRDPTARVVLGDPHRARVVVTPKLAGTAHVIVEVRDDGAPSLTSYRRIILRISAP